MANDPNRGWRRIAPEAAISPLSSLPNTPTPFTFDAPVSLTPLTFTTLAEASDAIANHKLLFVFFYLPGMLIDKFATLIFLLTYFEFFVAGCSHCNRFRPHWDQVMAELAGKVTFATGKNISAFVLNSNCF